MILRKFFVYVDDGCSAVRIPVPAVSEKEAKEIAQGFGEIIAVKDVTDDFLISLSHLRELLAMSHYGEIEKGFILRTLVMSGIFDEG